jgi:hypothetical protein
MELGQRQQREHDDKSADEAMGQCVEFCLAQVSPPDRSTAGFDLALARTIPGMPTEQFALNPCPHHEFTFFSASNSVRPQPPSLARGMSGAQLG